VINANEVPEVLEELSFYIYGEDNRPDRPRGFSLNVSVLDIPDEAMDILMARFGGFHPTKIDAEKPQYWYRVGQAKEPFATMIRVLKPKELRELARDARAMMGERGNVLELAAQVAARLRHSTHTYPDNVWVEAIHLLSL
jgi:hypothetical protein